MSKENDNWMMRLSDMEIGIGWASWNCYDSRLQWACNFNRWPRRRTKEDWVVRLTFLGFYVEWLPRAFYFQSREDRAVNIVPLFPNPIEHPWILEDAEFEMASEESEYDIWVITADGGKHGLVAKDAIQLCTSGGKGPDRFRNWMARVWFFKEYVEKPNELGAMSYHSQPDDGEG